MFRNTLEIIELDEAANVDLFGADDGTKVDVTKFDDENAEFMGKKKKKKKKGLIEITGEDDETAELADELNDLDLVTKKKKKKAKIIDLPVEVSRKS